MGCVTPVIAPRGRKVLNMRKRNIKKIAKIFIVLTVFSIILLVSGCSNNKASTKAENGKIIPVELSKDEKQLLNAVGVQKYFVFQVSLPKGENGQAHCWIDYYHKGVIKRIMDGNSIFNTNGDNTEKIVLATLEADQGANEQKWIISYIGNSGSSRLISSIPIDKDGATTSASTNGSDIIKGKPVILAVMTYNQSVCPIIPQTVFTGEVTAFKDLISDNDSVYVFRFELE